MLRAPRRGSGLRHRAVWAGIAAAGLALGAAACGPASAGPASGSVGTTPTSGGVVTYATEPGLNVNYIFPFVNYKYIDVSNTDEFQYLLYRPLYWFGKGRNPYLNTQLSLADPPQYKGRDVTIKLKNYRWSNGRPVTAQNVMFWINMQLGDPSQWGGQVGGQFPFNVTNIKTHGNDEITMTMDKQYSQLWFTYNELSQITPMPEAWDRTATSTSSDCSTVPSACVAVYNYLDSKSQPGTMGSWASSPLWSVVDGPWKVLRANNDGNVTMGLNPDYSGKGSLPAHHISTFDLVPFASQQAEFNVLQDPQGPNKLDVGYLPTVDAPVPPPGTSSGGNPVTLPDYTLTPLYSWALTYGVYNWTDPTAGPIFARQYFRQVFQSLVDQEGVINGPLHGYGKPTIGPVTSWPVTKFLSKTVEAGGDKWGLNLTKAEGLLSQNGWHVVPNGLDTCIKAGSQPGDCGPGIRLGAPLKFNMIYSSGVDSLYSATKELVSNALLVGIRLNTTAEPLNVVGATASCLPAAGQPPCTAWQIADWGAWSYSPDYLPTGEELFQKSSAADAGQFGNPADDALINATLQARTVPQFYSAMYKWEDSLAPELPVIYEPNQPFLIESVNNLNIGTQSSTLTINPEDWFYLK